MTKFFISHPMNGKTDDEIKSDRVEIIEKIHTLFGESCAVEIIDSFFEYAPDGATPLWYLGESIKLMSQADVVVFVKGWKDARGCFIEHECAKRYDKRIVYI